jgi:hypothetical protein
LPLTAFFDHLFHASASLSPVCFAPRRLRLASDFWQRCVPSGSTTLGI